MDREAKMREVVRKVRDDRTYGCADLDSQEKYDKNQVNDNVVMEVELSPEASSGAAGDSSRPMWALTEDQAKEFAGGIETAEADDLLSFANSLDFDKYINDTEISALVQNVRSRICELEAYQDSVLKRPIDTSLSCKTSSAIWAVPLPLVVNHPNDATGTIEGKNSVSNLPYMHRNPAI